MAQEPGSAAAVEMVSRCGIHGLFGIGAPRRSAPSLARGREARQEVLRSRTTVTSASSTPSRR
jgi:hypothetical protein